MPTPSYVRENSDTFYVPDSGAPDRVIGRGMFIQAPGNLTVFRTPDETKDVTFRVSMLGVGLRPTAVTVESREEEEITATDLRAVNVQRIWRAAIVRHVKYLREDFQMTKDDPEGRVFLVQSPIRLADAKIERLRLKGPEQETLEYVADMYTLASALGLAPALFVQEAFAGESLEPLPRTTATKWIKRARDLGLIYQSRRDGDD